MLSSIFAVGVGRGHAVGIAGAAGVVNEVDRSEIGRIERIGRRSCSCPFGKMPVLR